MRYHVLDKDGSVLMSNIELSALDIVLNFPEGRSILYSCPMHRKTCRCGKLTTKHGVVYLCMNSEINSKRIFKDRLSSINFSLENLLQYKNQMLQDRDEQLKTLRHNLIELNGHAIQALYKLIPQEKLGKGTISQKETISRIIEANKQEAAETILKLMKIEALVKTEFLIEKFLNGSASKEATRFSCHLIEKVFYLAYSIFTADFEEKEIKVTFKSSEVRALIDYETVITGVRQIFNNIVKYSCPGSGLTISFLEDSDRIRVVFDMITLKVDEDENEKIFESGYSGRLAIQLGKAGNGIGLFVAKKCFDFNEAIIVFSNNVREKDEVNRMGICYQNNQISISFKKCS